MSLIFRSASRIRAARLACLMALGLALLGFASPARAVIPTAASSAYEFDSIPLGAATAAGAAATFGNGIFVQGQIPAAAGNVMTSPGHGFKSNNFGVAGARTFAQGFLGGLPRNSGLIVDAAKPSVGQARSILTAYGTYYGGGGIALLPGSGAKDANTANNNATVNVTSAAAFFQNPAPAAITLQSGAWFAFSGFIPNGAYGSVGISSSVFVPGTGAFAQIPSLVFAIDPGGPAANFVQANGLVSTVNGANPLLYGLSTKPAMNNGVAGVNFAAYGVSYGPLVTVPAFSAPADLRGTITIVADPGADIEWNPSVLPSDIVLPTYGSDVPEPASASLLGLALVGVVCRPRRRARSLQA
jgi:hypothetical protein